MQLLFAELRYHDHSAYERLEFCLMSFCLMYSTACPSAIGYA